MAILKHLVFRIILKSLSCISKYFFPHLNIETFKKFHSVTSKLITVFS